MRNFAIMLILSLAISSCIAFCYRREVKDDIQAYSKKYLLPDMRGYGNDLAP